jgi:hypothetical protein
MPHTNDATSRLWCVSEAPHTDDLRQLVNEIKFLAGARRREARTHRPGCGCDGCWVRHRNAVRQAVRSRIA